jgi:hypothetical protein
MNHQEALRCAAVEQYLLNEMPGATRDEFEEHYFDCPECAADLRTTAAFLDGAKKELRRPASDARAAPAVRRPWFEFLWKPAFAAPAFALLLLVVTYQNAVVLPRYADAAAQLKRPEILTSLSLIGGNSRGGAVPAAVVGVGHPLLLSVDIPTAERFASYSCVLMALSGAIVWRLPVSTDQAKDTVAIRLPADILVAGDYRLIVQGHAAVGAGETTDLASYRFTLNRPQ